MSPDSLGKLTIDKSRQMPTSSVKWRFRRAILAACALLVVVIAVVVISRNRRVTIETTSVSLVYPTQSFTLLNASGYVVAQRKASVSSKITGKLEWLGVEEGSKVIRGQVIARLENRDLAVNVQQSEAAIQSSKAVLEQNRAEQLDAFRAFERQRDLLKQGIVAQADFDVAEARVKRVNASIKGAEAAIRNSAATLQGSRVAYDYSLIRAPFDAVVLTKNADVGDIITPLGAAANAKAAVFTIADMASLEVEADVSESNLGQLMKNQPCEITLDALPNARFRGVIHTIVPTADRTKASVMVKVRFIDSDSRILPEMSAKVAFLAREAKPAEQRPRIAVNPAAVVKSGNREGVWLLKDDRVVFMPVVRGGMLGDLIEVGGVKSGDKVALSPLDKLRDGTRIKLAEKK